ncbi:hypothetical protein MTO96_031682 [Rhipicephalus appendiculatus]
MAGSSHIFFALWLAASLLGVKRMEVRRIRDENKLQTRGDVRLQQWESSMRRKQMRRGEATWCLYLTLSYRLLV